MNAIIETTTSVDQQRRVDAAVAALAPNTRRPYGSAWSGWERWAADHGRQTLPAVSADVADYLEARHAGGASPATVRTARADVAKVHQVLRARRSHGGWSVRDVLHAIGRDGRNRGRGQVAGIGWAHAEAAMQELDPSLTDQQAIDRMVAEFQDSRELFAYLEDQLAGLRMYSDVAELNAFGGSWHCRIGSQLLQRADQCPGRSLGGKGRSLLSAVRSNQPRQVRAPLRAARPSRPRTTPYQSAPSGQAMHLWRQHAERAVDILRHTTQIAGHHTHHDAVYRILRGRLDETVP